MKANRLIWAFPLLLLLGTAAAEQTISQNATNQAAQKSLATPKPPDGSAMDPKQYLSEKIEEIRAKAMGGAAVAQLALGLCYYTGAGVTKDVVEAVKWYRKAAEQGLADAQLALGSSYFNGDGVPGDFAEAVKWYRKAAEQDSADAQYFLGLCFLDGHGVAVDAIEALKWFRKAADQGNAKAQCYLGGFYLYGIVTAKDPVAGVIWYRKAADQGIPEAQYTLGRCYREGRGVDKDVSEAVKWFRKAAEQGLMHAQDQLGVCYQDGIGVSRDTVEAVKWFRKAADQGCVNAQVSLGTVYFFGESVSRDSAQAVKLYQKAAEQGDARGEALLGICYYQGAGVPKNDVEAYKWLSLGCAQELPGEILEKARDFLNNVAAKMSREEIVEAQRRAAAFVPRQQTPVTAKGHDISNQVAGDVQPPKATGTGFFITDDGYLITNEHVVKDAAQVRLVTSAGLISARVVKVDAANDLALLKAEGRFAALPIAASRGMKLGGTVATVGFPNIGLQGFAPKFARGEIASLSGAGDDARYFQISVPVQPGNSGGALVDERGNVVGVVSAKLNAAAALQTSGSLPENVNYAVKSSYLLSFLESVPEVSAKLKEANTKEIKFEEVVEKAKRAAVLVLVY